MFGFYNIHKPAGPSSHDVVYRVRRLLPRGVKVGHAGTLDPFATGVLVICVGQATKLADHVHHGPKRYRAVVTLGAGSDTDDLTGEITPCPAAQPPDERHLAQTLAQFVGEIRQTPPAHSAVHVNGVRAYHLARQGQTPDLAARTVHVYALDILEYAWPDLTLDVQCASGVYIRSLARDIGLALGVGGYCRALERTACGAFTVDSAHALADLDIHAHLQSPLTALTHLPKIQITADQRGLLVHGSTLTLGDKHAPGPVALVAGDFLLALGDIDTDGRSLHPRKVFIAV